MQPERAFLDSGGPFAHTAVAYGSESGFLRRVQPLIAGALRESRRVLVVTSERGLDLVGDAFGSDARLIDRHPAEKWYAHPTRTLAAFHDYVRQRERPLVIGEPVWSGWTERQAREWVRYESVLNAAFAGVPVSLWCLYDESLALDHVPRTHPTELTGAGLRRSDRYVSPERFELPGDDLPLPDPPPAAVVTDFTLEELGRLRALVTDHARRVGMRRDLVASLVLSVSEMAANSVEHGAGHGRATIWTSGGEIVCEISDSGGGELDVPLPGYLPPEPGSPRGYGLWISRQLCDLVQVRGVDGELRVRLHMALD
ncbi:anti-sigma factor RsbA family regulatory protein [Streptosporangium sp. NPDC002721]|uniref:anti-sigma factor RsbA family regulatory protein n=1 Tax=Streptosporangium sp. NPDC002721 TaxID=3366188 RepID=UPI0036A63607